MDTNPATDFPDDCDFFNAAYLFRQAVRDGADVISVSLELGPTKQLKAAIQEALDKGVVVVAAAGLRRPANLYYGLSYPAWQPGVVAVNAVGRDGRPYVMNPRPLNLPGKRQFSVISAPGAEVDSSGYRPGRGWVSGGTRSGTSDAAPIVAGALALVKSKYPDATGNQLIQQLIHYTTTAGKYYWDRQYGFGIVSAKRMLEHDPTGWPDVNPLLHGPKQAVATYPLSSYGHASAATPSASASPAAASARPSRTAAASTTKTAASHDGGGVPVWVWPVAGLLVAGALALAAIGAVRRRGAPAPQDRGQDSRLQAAHDNTREV
jgi:subtilisin family serine protease